MLKFLHVDTPTLFEVCVPLAPRHLRGDRIGVTALLQSLLRRPSPSTISLSSSDPHGILQDLHQVPSVLHGDRRTLLPLSPSMLPRHFPHRREVSPLHVTPNAPHLPALDPFS